MLYRNFLTIVGKYTENFTDNILYREIIQKISVFCPLGIDYPEKVGTINS
ncbi:hypothetical protein [Rippkaea orientalis]|nr:hypothetical protein [Rippkaea orientalis]